MLTLPFIRANQDTTIAGLQKKHFANATEIVAKLIAQDDQRKALLQQAESALEKSNAAAKEIGALMQSGQKELAEGKRAETSALKASIKEMEEAAKAAEKAEKAAEAKVAKEAKAAEAKKMAEEKVEKSESDIDYAHARAELAVAVAELAAIAKYRNKR
jgi:seryl-tRNA synthetase